MMRKTVPPTSSPSPSSPRWRSFATRSDALRAPRSFATRSDALRAPRSIALVATVLVVPSFFFACAKSKESAATSAAPAATAMANDQAKSAPGGGSGGKDEEKKEDAKGSGPKTWKRAGSATHTARISIGDKETLPVRAMQMKVVVDGFRARVVMDAYFENDR